MPDHDLAIDELCDFSLYVFEMPCVVHVLGPYTRDPRPPVGDPLFRSDKRVQDDVAVVVHDRDPCQAGFHAIVPQADHLAIDRKTV